MAIRFVQVDAFTNTPFAGNPAAVCIVSSAAPEQWMKDVAREMNLSETAFLVPREDGWQLRWLTPAVEVDLCGHATLASAHVLWEDGHLAAGAEARFHTRSGLLRASRIGDWIEMDFPATPAEPVADGNVPPELVAALGAKAMFIGRPRFDWLVEVGSEAEVRALAPDLTALRKCGARGVIVTAQADPGPYDFVSRFFAPGAGVDEDPVTGSAHCALAPYWAGKLGKPELTGFQASARGGVVRVRVEGDRVKLGGQAVIVIRGELLA
jgi:PhzF family phenazine biosynthesis protein